MFSLLRRRRARVLAPLRGMHWDGRTLELHVEPGTAAIALDLDGAYFDTATCSASGIARFGFDFAPNGALGMLAQPRRARDDAPLTRAPLRLMPGKGGFAGTVAAAAPPSPRRVAGGAQPAPFGSDAAGPEVAIIVPVYNAASLVERCLASVVAHTTGRARLIVIDDASSEAAIAPLLARCAGHANVSVLRNEVNRGFTATANRGITVAGEADVVLLNADTEVGPNWLQGLRRAIASDAAIATATAVSDNAGAFSVPELEQANTWPASWRFVDAARALWQQAGLAYPQLPTGNGYCMYIRRRVIAAVGALDEAAFPQGYGEENDFCQRAAQQGWRHVIAGNVYVHHARSASFGAERRATLGAAGMAVLHERWPAYEADVGRMLPSFERRVLDWRVRRAFAGAALAMPRPRLLWVGAGAPTWSDAEVWNLLAHGKQNELRLDGALIAASTWQAHDPEPSYRALWDWLQVFAIEALLVTRAGDTAVEILCRLLDIPIIIVHQPLATSAAGALAAGQRALRSFGEMA